MVTSKFRGTALDKDPTMLEGELEPLLPALERVLTDGKRSTTRGTVLSRVERRCTLSYSGQRRCRLPRSTRMVSEKVEEERQDTFPVRCSLVDG